MTETACSLVFLEKGDLVYLARGKKGVNDGYLNGYGGKQELDETVAESAVRELPDESEVTINQPDLRKVCVITFHRDAEITGLGRPETRTLYLHVYVVSRWNGQPQETHAFEAPSLFRKDQLPLDQMLPDNHRLATPSLIGWSVVYR